MSRVTFADDIFDNDAWPLPEPARGLYMKSPDFLVQSQDREGAAAALLAAGKRFPFVSHTGRELDEWENNGGEYTPNYVSDVYLTDAGPALYTDTKGEMSAEMGDAMLRILTEELSARHVEAHICAMDALDPDAPIWAPLHPLEPTTDETAVDQSWYLVRPVWRRTTTGVDYEDCEWWDGDRWNNEKSAAEHWEAGPPDLLTQQLRTEMQPPMHGEPTCLLLPADTVTDPWAMPPSDIRSDRRPTEKPRLSLVRPLPDDSSE